MAKDPMIVVCVRIPRTLRDQIVKIAENKKLNFSDIVRIACVQFVDKKEAYGKKSNRPE